MCCETRRNLVSALVCWLSCSLSISISTGTWSVRRLAEWRGRRWNIAAASSSLSSEGECEWMERRGKEIQVPPLGTEMNEVRWRPNEKERKKIARSSFAFVLCWVIVRRVIFDAVVNKAPTRETMIHRKRLSMMENKLNVILKAHGWWFEDVRRFFGFYNFFNLLHWLLLWWWHVNYLTIFIMECSFLFLLWGRRRFGWKTWYRFARLS